MRTRAMRIHKHADRALTTSLNDRTRRLTQQRNITLQQLRMITLKVIQAIELLRHLLALISDQRQIMRRLPRLRQACEGTQVASQTRLHIH